jgi:AmmeMemoRadiSam system protein A
MRLGKAEKAELLLLARESVRDSVDPGSHGTRQVPGRSGALSVRCGAFVSLYVDNELRGCIGTFSEEDSLYNNVKNMAVSAATTDTRFKLITPEELNRLKIEISVLTPRTRIYDISDIVIGIHGIYMIHGLNRGTLLPQVAVNQNWNVEEFLGNCARYKAGIGWEGWKSADLYTYEALVFSSPPPSSK